MICEELICDICANNSQNRTGNICGRCVDYDEFCADVDLISDALEDALEAEHALADKIQHYIQENTSLRAKLERAEKRIEAQDEKLEEAADLCHEAGEIMLSDCIYSGLVDCFDNCMAIPDCTNGRVIRELKAFVDAAEAIKCQS